MAKDNTGGGGERWMKQFRKNALSFVWSFTFMFSVNA